MLYRVVRTEEARFNSQYLKVGLGESSGWNSGELLPISVDTAELDGPVVSDSIRFLCCSGGPGGEVPFLGCGGRG